MPAHAPKIALRKFVRVRDRNQITLPAGLPVRSGDFVEIVLEEDGHISMTPAVLVAAGTREAAEQESTADQDIAKGRYKTFSSAEELVSEARRNRRARGRAPAHAARAKGEPETA
jgi:ribosomal protein S12